MNSHPGQPARTTSSESLRFCNIADPHITIPTGQECERLVDESVAAFKTALKQALALAPDFLVFTGDVIEARRHARENLDLAHRLLSEIRIPWFVCVGNHDIRYRSTIGPYEKIDFFAKFSGHGPGGSRGYWRHDWPQKRIALLSLDSTKEFHSGGAVSEEQWSWLEDQVRRLPEDWRAILFSHHPLVVYDPLILKIPAMSIYVVDEHEIALGRLAALNGKIKCVINGHCHFRKTAVRDGIVHVACPSVNTWPLSLTYFSFDRAGFDYRYIDIEDRRLDALARQKLFSANSTWLHHLDEKTLLKYFSTDENAGRFEF